jgi:hypothetical protein
MLQDLLSLEQYGDGSALFIDELLKHYGEEPLKYALQQGFLVRRIICIGPDCGRCLCWLSDAGRLAASLQ